jgi:molybdate transport system substrate-binding protein
VRGAFAHPPVQDGGFTSTEKPAKAALENLGVWSSVESKMAMTVNVRAALAYVARGEAPLGIVYATDAKMESRVKVVGVFPDNSHDPIT